MVAGVVGVAEAVIYAVYVGKVARAKKREAMLRERKVVVGREEIGGRTATGRESVSAAREEIWGRGVNGGLRRRVRERWEEGEGEN